VQNVYSFFASLGWKSVLFITKLSALAEQILQCWTFGWQVSCSNIRMFIRGQI